MTQEEYIKTHPELFKDEIDKWLFLEFGILGGCCSAEKSHEYYIARMVAEKYEENRLIHCDGLTPEQAQIESDFIVNHLKKNKRIPTFIDAIEFGMRMADKTMIEKACKWLQEHVRDYMYYDADYQDVNIDVDDLIYTFKKAMEE